VEIGVNMDKIRSVKVLYHGRQVGTLSMGNGLCCQFEYHRDWLRDGFSISPLQLPLKAGLFTADYRPFDGNFGVFEDSLPGGYGDYLLQKLLRRKGIDYHMLSPVQRLSLVGKSGMGALCYVPETKMAEVSANATLDEMQAMALEVLAEKTDENADLLLAGSGNSGGVRPKCLFNDADGHWLVKFRHVYDQADVGETEFRYNEAARCAGIDVPEFRLMEGKYFASKRFDIDENGRRLHVATASALLNEPISPPKMDYHSLLQLTGFLTQSPVAVEQQFRRMVFNHYARNFDDHARNFSFICHDGRWELSPAYDLTNNQTLGEHATSVNFKGLPTDEDMVLVGTNTKMSRTRCLQIIEEVRDVAEKLLKDISTSRPIMHMVLAVCCLLSFFTPCAYSQTDASLEGNVSLEMVVVPAGTFTMGCTFEQAGQCAFDEKPAHQVALKSFAIAKYEVTQKLWKTIMGTNPSRVVGDDLPVQNVSWDEVQIFLLWLNQKTGKSYRLPTEAEWEFAARSAGGQKSRPILLYSGGGDLATVGWFYDNSGGTPHTVGTKKPNGSDLYDMSGNVWEWCSDLYGMYGEKALENPAGATDGIARVIRGGGADSRAPQCRVSARKSLYQGGSDNFTGFRLAMDWDLEPEFPDSTDKAVLPPPSSDQSSFNKAHGYEEELRNLSIRELLAKEKAAERAQKAEIRRSMATERKSRLDSLPPTFFLTLNAAYTSMPQWSYGFKVGTVKLFGWYFSAMTNFHYRGAFSSFQPNAHYVLTGISKTTYLGGQLGLVVRPHQLLSLHIGAGFGYRALTLESDQGWHYYPRRSYYGPTASLGAMFHIKNVVISAEATSMVYNLNTLNDARYAVGARVGVGVCLPIKN
jgi:serine/threonine-protein kinase HipA